MNYQLIPYAYVLFSSALVSMGILCFAWSRRSVPGAVPFIVLMFTSVVWSTSNALEMMGLDLQTKLFWANIQYICYNSITISWFIMALQYTGLEKLLNRRRFLMLLIIPVLTVIFVWTNDWHGLMRRNIYLDTSGPFPVIGKTFGPWFWVNAVYSYPLVFAACVLFIRAMFRMLRHFRWQTLALLFGMLLPYLANLLYTFKFTPLKYDISPVLFSICGIFYTWGLFRFQLFDRLPAARRMVIQSMGDGMIIFDKSGRVTDYNPAALRIVGLSGSIAGRTVTEIFDKEIGDSFNSISGGHREIIIHSHEKTGYYAARWWPIFDLRKQMNGWVLLLHDVTDVKEAQQEVLQQQKFTATLEERERLARELHDSLGQVLGYMNIQIQAIRDKLFAGRASEANDNLVHLSQVIEEANTEIREFIYGIKTTLLFKDGFFSTLEQYLSNFRITFSIEVYVKNSVGIKDQDLSLPVQAQLFRIIQEALTNVRKHAKARQVTILFEKIDRLVRIIISDDGIGFNMNKISEGKHFGQGIMAERAIQVGGEVRVQSTPGEGTQVIIEIPLSDQNFVLPHSVSTKLKTSPETVTQLKLLLVDDHALFLDGLQNLLVSKGFQVVATAKNGWEALEKTRIFQPNLILMDIQMPGCDGLMGTRLIKTEFPESKIVILTMSDREKDLCEAMKSGAFGYLLKGQGADVLIEELYRIINGEIAISSNIASQVLNEFIVNEASQSDVEVAVTKNTPELTPRQADVLVMVAQGWTYREIGQKLFLSESTIKFHMREIIERLHLKNRAEVAAYAREIGLKKQK